MVYHEQQESSLCAQHALNALLQGPYFSAMDLATLGRELDDIERIARAEGGVDSKEYLEFVAGESQNVNDSGFFSVQVIENALKVFALGLVPLRSVDAAIYQDDLLLASAYICNHSEHWITLRKIGHQWWNLDSTLEAPARLSDTYVAMFVAQLQGEGYSIFVVTGDLPVVGQAEESGSGRLGDAAEEDDLEKAIRMSLMDAPPTNSSSPATDVLSAAAAAAEVPTQQQQQQQQQEQQEQQQQQLSKEEMRSKRLARFASQPPPT